jgi:hypothetical protein
VRRRRDVRPVALKAVMSTVALLLGACGGNDSPNDGEPPPSSQTFAVSGTVNGLTGTGLVLQNNAGDDLAIAANGAFTFAARLAQGAPYDVKIRTQPAGPDQICAVTSGAGNIAAANVTNVSVTCASPSAPSFTIGGTASGLNGTVVLRNNSGADLALSANGAFTFPETLPNGGAYDVAVIMQPASPPQICSVSNATGVISSANVTNIGVSCSEFMTVISSTPASAATSVVRNGNITVQFSANLNPASVNTGNVSLATELADQPVTVQSTDNQLTIKPNARLLPLTRYTVTITPGVEGAAGQQLAGIVTLTFTTRDGQWSAPRMIQSVDTTGYAPDFALDAQGNAIAIWTQVAPPVVGQFSVSQLSANRYVAGTGWGTASIISPDSSGVRAGEVGVDAAGNAIVVWTGSEASQELLMTARYTTAAGWGPELLLGVNGTAYPPHIAVAPNGDAIAIWEEVTDTNARAAWARHYKIGAGWDAGEVLASTATNTHPTMSPGMNPVVAIDRDGTAMTAFTQYANGSLLEPNLWTRYFDGTSWGTLEELELEPGFIGETSLAFDGLGRVFAAWTQTGGAGVGKPWSIWANLHRPGMGWELSQLIEQHPDAPGGKPTIAADGDGNALVVWQHSDLSRAATDIWSNRHEEGRGWEGERRIENQAKGNANFADLAMDASGNAIAVWKEQNDNSGIAITPGYQLWVNRFVAGSGWGIAQRMDVTDNGDIFDGPRIAIGANGDAIAVWSRRERDPVTASYGSPRVYAARFE